MKDGPNRSGSYRAVTKFFREELTDMSPKRIKVTKHMMKEDRLVTTTFKLTKYVQKHSREFMIAGAGVVVVILVVLFVISSNRGRNQKAAELLGKARVELESGEV